MDCATFGGWLSIAQTGTLWAADVGQDLWEEIDLIVARRQLRLEPARRTATPFSRRMARPAKNLIEPIWEYHHTLGKSITGGMVYRGKQIPELVGGYLYADYVTGKMWALFYDPDTRQVTANREIPLPSSIAVMSFGEDERGGSLFHDQFARRASACLAFIPAQSRCEA